MGAELEHRVGSGWLGLRLHGAYTQRPFALEGRTLGINMWLVDAGIVLRLSSPGRSAACPPSSAWGAGWSRTGSGVDRRWRSRRPTPATRATTNASGRASSESAWTWARSSRIQETPLGLRLQVVDDVAFRSPFDPISGERFDPVHNVRVTLSLVSMVGELPRLR